MQINKILETKFRRSSLEEHKCQQLRQRQRHLRRCIKDSYCVIITTPAVYFSEIVSLVFLFNKSRIAALRCLSGGPYVARTWIPWPGIRTAFGRYGSLLVTPSTLVTSSSSAPLHGSPELVHRASQPFARRPSTSTKPSWHSSIRQAPATHDVSAKQNSLIYN